MQDKHGLNRQNATEHPTLPPATMPLKKPGPAIHAAIALATAAIFALDLHTPLGLGVPFLYVLVALFAIGAGVGNRVLLAIAIVGPVLAGAKLLAPPTGGVEWFGQANRVFFSLLIWVAIGLEWGRRQLDAARQKNSQELERLVDERTAELHRANRELRNEVAERKQAEQTITDYSARLHALANQLVEAQEGERKALAAELHDRIGQNLTALSINLNLNLAAVTSQLPAGAATPVVARIKDSLALLEKTTEMVRGVMEELHPTTLEHYGLPAALRWYAEEFAGRTGIVMHNETSTLFPRLQPRVEMTLFRIVQEALTNVAKHAGASAVTISLRRSPAEIELTVADNGAGIAAEKLGHPAVGSGWGLTIMDERARSIGATLRIERLDDGGTRIVVLVPNERWEIEDDNHGTDR